MQLTPTEAQLQFIRTWVMEPILVPFLWYAVKRGVAAGVATFQQNLNSMITENSNRIRNELELELKRYMDQKFVNHEVSAFTRLDKIEQKVS